MQALHHSKYQGPVYFTAHARRVPHHDIYARALRMRVACQVVLVNEKNSSNCRMCNIGMV